MATFHKLTPKSSPSHPTQGYYPHLLTHGCKPAAFSMLQSLPSERGKSIQQGILRFQLSDLAGYVGLLCPINTACDQYCSIADQLYSLERALIDTGEATPSRKQLQAYTFKMSGPIGLARSQVLIIPGSSSLLHINRQHHFKNSRVSKTLDFYRIYCTKQNIRCSMCRISRDWNNKPTTCILVSKQLL